MTTDQAEILSDFKKFLKSLQHSGIIDLAISPETKKYFYSIDIDTDKSNFDERRINKISNAGKTNSKLVKNDSHGQIVLKNFTGDINSPLIFIWEYPSQKDLAQKAEQKIFDIVEKGMKLKRENICICSIIDVEKKAPDNINSIKSIQDFLKPLKPKVIVAMGSVAAAALGHKIDIINDHGRWLLYGYIKVIATHHPAYLLENYTEKVRREIFEDMKKVLKEL